MTARPWAQYCRASPALFSLRITDMDVVHIILLLAGILWAVQSHIVREEKQEKDNSDSDSIVRLSEILPPISIVRLKKTSRRVSRADAEKNKSVKKVDPPKKKPWTPPANCVPLKSSCRPPAPPCCEPCAICRCHIFQTVCIYKMGYPHC